MFWLSLLESSLRVSMGTSDWASRFVWLEAAERELIFIDSNRGSLRKYCWGILQWTSFDEPQRSLVVVRLLLPTLFVVIYLLIILWPHLRPGLSWSSSVRGLTLWPPSNKSSLRWHYAYAIRLGSRIHHWDEYPCCRSAVWTSSCYL